MLRFLRSCPRLRSPHGALRLRLRLRLQLRLRVLLSLLLPRLSLRLRLLCRRLCFLVCLRCLWCLRCLRCLLLLREREREREREHELSFMAVNTAHELSMGIRFSPSRAALLNVYLLVQIHGAQAFCGGAPLRSPHQQQTRAVTSRLQAGKQKGPAGQGLFTDVTSMPPLAPALPPLSITYTNEGGAVRQWLERHAGNNLKKSSNSDFNSKCIRALTFENLCQAVSAQSSDLIPKGVDGVCVCVCG